MALDTVDLRPESIVGGNPTASLRPLAHLGGTEVGVWALSQGCATDVEEDEVFVVVSGAGHLRVERIDETITLSPGAGVRLFAGDRTTWTIHETLRKVYLSAAALKGESSSEELA